MPVGGFSYSQGLEAAVNAGLVHDAATTQRWITDQFSSAFATWELPTLAAMHAACVRGDAAALTALNAEFIASREARELREETLQMGWSLRSLLGALLEDQPEKHALLQEMPHVCYPAAFACAAAAFDQPALQAVTAYAFAWVENQVAAAMKAAPLGQVAGQRVLRAFHPLIDTAAARAIAIPLDERSSFAPTLAMLSSRHETQYSRLFRS
ncbi:MAG: urease accessory protein UreF [Burkholderiaceae bacterium]